MMYAKFATFMSRSNNGVTLAKIVNARRREFMHFDSMSELINYINLMDIQIPISNCFEDISQFKLAFGPED